MGQLPLEGLVLLCLGKMPLEWNHLHSPGAEHGHVCHLWQMVGVDEQLEIGKKLEAVFIQEPGVDGIPACQRFHQCSREDHLLVRLGDIDHSRPRQPRYVLGGTAAVYGLLLRSCTNR